MKLIGIPIVITGVAASPPIPVDTRSNPINVFGKITDGGASTYALQYTDSDVFASGYNAAADTWTAIPAGSNNVLPTTGTAPFSVIGLGMTAIRVNVTVGPATVTISTVYQADNSLGA